MTFELLEHYIKNKEKIRELEYRLIHYTDNESMVGNDVIFDYRSGYPVPQSIIGIDWDRVNRIDTNIRKSLITLKSECRKVEEFIQGMEEQTKTIFELYYMEGETQADIAKRLKISQGTISKKIYSVMYKEINAIPYN